MCRAQTCHVAQIFVRLIAEPGALERALQPFTVSGFVPVRLSLRKNRSDGLFMTARYVGIDVDRAINLAVRLRTMPCARGVRISVRPGGGGGQEFHERPDHPAAITPLTP
jgi:hypothetical protein